MISISHSQRYYPHELHTKYHAVNLYRQVRSISFVCRRYKISKASLMRWNKKFDGNKKSLIDKSHKPLTPHPNSHTEEELTWIRNYIRRNPNISMIELYGKLRIDKGYSRHACSLFRILRKMGYVKQRQHNYKKYVPKPYDTPKDLGVKWQMDVKYISKRCYTGKIPDKFYQYTIIDEASRERFIYPYKEQSSYTTIDFVKRAIVYFGYSPKIIQTDNGQEFTHLKMTNRIHPFTTLCKNLNIKHQLIRPRTPRHNGKVERSHRNDNERFYKYLSFYSYDDLLLQMKRYLRRSNNIPMQTLNWLSPLQMRHKLINNN
ncbi:MAG: DDE-type integrase/transposase/recombinase [Bacilli bacterium]|jgi:transposase InsO family protein